MKLPPEERVRAVRNYKEEAKKADQVSIGMLNSFVKGGGISAFNDGEKVDFRDAKVKAAVAVEVTSRMVAELGPEIVDQIVDKVDSEPSEGRGGKLN